MPAPAATRSSNTALLSTARRCSRIHHRAGTARRPAGVRTVARSHRPTGWSSSLNRHRFRHSVVAIALDQGVKLEAISKVLGHSSVRTTKDTYGMLQLSTKKAAGRPHRRRVHKIVAAWWLPAWLTRTKAVMCRRWSGAPPGSQNLRMKTTWHKRRLSRPESAVPGPFRRVLSSLLSSPAVTPPAR
jgi:hypothetical protein